jgi:hypothetical protein
MSGSATFQRPAAAAHWQSQPRAVSSQFSIGPFRSGREKARRSEWIAPDSSELLLHHMAHILAIASAVGLFLSAETV